MAVISVTFSETQRLVGSLLTVPWNTKSYKEKITGSYIAKNNSHSTHMYTHMYFYISNVFYTGCVSLYY